MIIGFAFIFTLVYNHAGGSVLLAVALHTVINATSRTVNILFGGHMTAARWMPLLWCVTAVEWLAVLRFWFNRKRTGYEKQGLGMC
ncbi:MAG: hypothetical protein JW934_24135 [Anaerolineae bacterium]|nr:hypothetical protein [Anaerolineae bacterium]